MVLTFEYVDAILKCDHSNESYQVVLSCGNVCCAVQGDSNILVYKENPKLDQSDENLQCGDIKSSSCGWNSNK